MGSFSPKPSNISDKNSKLDPEEVQWWLENHGKYVTDKQAKRIVEQMDFDGDGFCDYNDFLAVILAKVEIKNNEVLSPY